MNLFALLILCLTICGSVGIKLVDNKYEDVYIVIQKTVAEDPLIIDNIKDTFTAASSLLFNATHKRVYFGKINIIIPKEWTNVTNTKPIPSIKLKNFILVDEGQNENPFVKSTECGKEGLYMYLPPSFLLKKGETGFGRKEKVIVHEWGQLRWGLFSEYHPSHDKKFYLDEGRWKPTVCTELIQGRIGIGRFCSNKTHICLPDNGGSRMPSNCSFCPHRQQTANASIMGYQYIESVSL
ncbi:calcium-activated chloride channel regulator 1-like [Dreissena polymorpha]|uniref:calcium-activated chloride channel regulator 1-like n=1 Tax=Dreissena polymorpha TaxID=45954 RepID=UPI002264E1EA|nr:calcium-activated chloride channel regulator 1-like [Dreissena polymorpha]